MSEVAESILFIPLVANLAPIAWFAGVPLHIPTLDAIFLAALGHVKGVFMKDYPEISDEDSPIEVENPVENRTYGTKHAMLFSGGVDAYATFFRHREEGLDLISIRGADIPIEDVTQWQRLIGLNAREPLLRTHSKQYIAANLRDFYTYRVTILIPTKAWWGTVQHGLALNALVAPLAYVRGYSKLYIASSYTKSIEIAWGSTPEIDNSISWAGCSVEHDGYELQRIDKIGLIISKTNASQKKVNLRVCYSELNHGLNCSKCEKCFRTMLGVSLFGADPDEYGFDVEHGVYKSMIDMLSSGFKSAGSRYFWWELSERMRLVGLSGPHLLGTIMEYQALERSLKYELDQPIQATGLGSFKLALMERFPKVFSMYLKVRRKLS
ncbi:hypothetical protein [Halomonas alimentaria]|uniref:hypothetical protein n=1 Tax=Halomonas alimentaria TaxID=147248 RepID=UPI0024939B67|nr:hypothetical protein [Halomonas alimentaria]